MWSENKEYTKTSAVIKILFIMSYTSKLQLFGDNIDHFYYAVTPFQFKYIFIFSVGGNSGLTKILPHDKKYQWWSPTTAYSLAAVCISVNFIDVNVQDSASSRRFCGGNMNV